MAAVIFFTAAFLLACDGRNGWGWFLLVGLFVMQALSA